MSLVKNFLGALSKRRLPFAYYHLPPLGVVMPLSMALRSQHYGCNAISAQIRLSIIRRDILEIVTGGVALNHPTSAVNMFFCLSFQDNGQTLFCNIQVEVFSLRILPGKPIIGVLFP